MKQKTNLSPFCFNDRSRC